MSIPVPAGVPEGEGEQELARLYSALQRAQADGDDREELEALYAFALAARSFGAERQALTLFRAGLARALEDGSDDLVGRFAEIYGVVLAETGAVVDAAAAFKISAARFKKVSDWPRWASNMANLAGALWHAGEFRECIVVCDQAVRFYRSGNESLKVGQMLNLAGRAYHRSGRFGTAERMFMLAQKQLGNVDDAEGELGESFRLLSHTYVEANQPAKAERALDRARDLLRRHTPITGSSERQQVESNLNSSLGMLRQKQERWTEAALSFDAAATGYAKLGHRPNEANCRMNLGLARLGAGDSGGAVTALELARELYEVLECPLEALWCRSNIALANRTAGRLLDAAVEYQALFDEYLARSLQYEAAVAGLLHARISMELAGPDIDVEAFFHQSLTCLVALEALRRQFATPTMRAGFADLFTRHLDTVMRIAADSGHADLLSQLIEWRINIAVHRPPLADGPRTERPAVEGPITMPTLSDGALGLIHGELPLATPPLLLMPNGVIALGRHIGAVQERFHLATSDDTVVSVV